MIYSSYQIANIIGVNVSTIKRWTDSGDLKCYQSVGGHRKFHLQHVIDFLEKNNKSKTNINLNQLIGKNNKLNVAINETDYDYLIKYSYKKLIKGDAEKFMSINNALILKGHAEYLLFDNLINPILRKIGDEWLNGKITITEEHLASEIIRKFLSNLNFQHLSKNSTYNAFCFTLNNDKHDIPLHMTESIFNQHGKIKTFNLGPSLPVEDFLNLSQKVTPHIIFISMIYSDDLNSLSQQLNLLCKAFTEAQNTYIFLKGRMLKKLRLKHSNYIEINNYSDLKSQLVKNIT